MRANTPTNNSISRAALVLLLFAFWLMAASPAQQQLANLKSRADAAQGGEKISLSLDYAHQELEYANKLYTDGDVEKGEAAVGEVMTYARQAVQTAIATNKRLKSTEIDLRKLQHRMRDIGQSLNVDDRPPVEKSVQELEQLRSNLLGKMFGDKAEPKEKAQ